MNVLFTKVLVISACCCSVRASPVSAVNLVNAIKFVDSTVSIINGIKDFFGGDGSNSDITSLLTNAVNDIKEHINSAKTEVLNQILFNRKYDRIEDVVAVIHALMIELQHLVESNTTEHFRENVEIFKTRFDESNMPQHIYWLPELLTYTAPGETNNFLESLAKDSRCSATELDELKKFYNQLLSNGISLQFVWRTLNDFKLEQKRQFWTDTLTDLEKKFQFQNDECDKQLPVFALEDLRNTHDANALSEKNKERYRKQSDVMFFSQEGTHQFTHIEDVSNDFLLQKDGNTYKIASFYSTELQSAWNSNEMSRILSANISTLRDVITKDGVQTASQIAAVAKCILNESSPPVKVGSVVVFFKDQFEHPSIIINQGSPVASVVINDVQLEYCHKSGFECSFNFIFDAKESANGEFHVYIYPLAASQDGAKINGAESISTGLASFLMLVIMSVCYLFC